MRKLAQKNNYPELHVPVLATIKNTPVDDDIHANSTSFSLEIYSFLYSIKIPKFNYFSFFFFSPPVAKNLDKYNIRPFFFSLQL